MQALAFLFMFCYHVNYVDQINVYLRKSVHREFLIGL